MVAWGWPSRNRVWRPLQAVMTVWCHRPSLTGLAEAMGLVVPSYHSPLSLPSEPMYRMGS
jgi:hypothetical protein